MTASSGISTRFPVGATPGSIHGISVVWVKQNSISSTTCVAPTVREIGTSEVSGGLLLTKWFV
ncbi:hypothetical protein D9M68_767580 [compost metagenome]